MAKLKGTRIGAVRAYTFGILVMMAAFMFGYDTGIVGGVLKLDSFHQSFNYDPDDEKKQALIVGLQQLGAFIAALLIAPITDHFGRKWVVIVACGVFCAGVIFQTVPTHGVGWFYAGRLVAGFGLGACYCVVPIYSAEMSPKEIRGQLGACFQWMFTWGILVSYWVDYAVLKTMPTIDAQWQIPIGLQMAPAGILALGLLTQPESMRWLMKKGREEDSWKSLSWIRADEGEEARVEFAEIRMGILEEMRATEGFRRRELLEPANRKRLSVACIMFMNTQLTGSSALAYFGPQFFSSIVGEGDKNLLITALFGVVKVVACTCFIFFVAERFGRKNIFIAGALGMSTCMLITAVLNKTYPPRSGDDPKVTSEGIGMVALIFINIIIYNFSWGPLPHPYVTEIFPARIRAIGVSAGSATQWAFNFTFSIATPYMISSMGWGVFLFYACTDIWSATYCYFFLQETRAKSLEEMETVWHSAAAFDVEKVREEARLGKQLDDVGVTAHVEGPSKA